MLPGIFSGVEMEDQLSTNSRHREGHKKAEKQTANLLEVVLDNSIQES